MKGLVKDDFMWEDIFIVVFLVAIFAIFIGLLGNQQTRKIISDLLFGRM